MGKLARPSYVRTMVPLRAQLAPLLTIAALFVPIDATADVPSRADTKPIERLCGEGTTAEFTRPSSGPAAYDARFVVLADGSVETDRRRPLSVSFFGDHVAAARVILIHGNDRRVVACGSAKGGTTYPLPTIHDAFTRFEVEVYDSLNLEPTSTDPAKGAALAALDKRRSTLDANTAANAYYKAYYTNELDLALRRVKLESVSALLQSFPAANCIAPARAGCTQEAKGLADALAPVHASLKEAAEAMTDAETATPGSPQEIRLLARATAALDLARRQMQAPKTSLVSNETLNEKLKTAYCSREGERLWLRDTSGPKLMRRTRAVLPAVDRFGRVRYGSGSAEIEGIPTNGPYPILVNAVPTGTSLKMTTKFSAPAGSKVEDLAKLAATIMYAAAKAGPAAPGIKAPCDSIMATMSDDIPAVAELEARTALVMPVADKLTEVSICEGDACKADGEAPTIRNVVTLHPPSKRRFTVLLDFGINPLGIFFSDGADAFARSKYDAIGGLAGPDQRFVLRRSYDLRDRMVISLLAGARWGRWIVAVGPGLSDLAGSSAFNQWVARVGFGVSDSFFVTAGAGVRFGKRPADQAYGDELSIPRTAPGAVPAAAPLAEESAPSFTLGAGLAFDLAALASSAETLVNSFRKDAGSTAAKKE